MKISVKSRPLALVSRNAVIEPICFGSIMLYIYLLTSSHGQVLPSCFLRLSRTALRASEQEENPIVTRAREADPREVDLEKVVREAEEADDERLARELTSEYDDISESIALAAVRDAEENNPEAMKSEKCFQRKAI